MQKKKSSKELLKESVIELVSHTPVEKVTVGMICENCGVSQRTFYNYFRDKLDLISWAYVSTLDACGIGSEATLRPVMTALVTHLIEFSDFYTNVIRYTGQNNFKDSIFTPLQAYLHRLITEVFGDTLTQDLSDSVDFFIFGCLGYMEHYFLKGEIVPAEITMPRFEANIPESLRKYL